MSEVEYQGDRSAIDWLDAITQVEPGALRGIEVEIAGTRHSLNLQVLDGLESLALRQELNDCLGKMLGDLREYGIDVEAVTGGGADALDAATGNPRAVSVIKNHQMANAEAMVRHTLVAPSGVRLLKSPEPYDMKRSRVLSLISKTGGDTSPLVELAAECGGVMDVLSPNMQGGEGAQDLPS